VVPYSITGVSSADIGNTGLNGSFVVSSFGSDSRTFTAANDFLIEGDETFILTLNGISPSVNTSVIIRDTSVPLPTYRLSANKSIIDEGESFLITLITTNVDNGTSIPYTITGVSSADISNTSLTGSFTVSSNGTASVSFTAANDLLIEGDETFILTLNSISPSVSASVTIRDTSVPLPTYRLSANKSIVDEGESFSIRLYTTGVANGASIPYTITGVSSAVISDSLTGTFVLDTGSSSKTFSVPANILSAGNEIMKISLNGLTPEVSESVTIRDLFQAVPTPTDPIVDAMLLILFETDIFNGIGTLVYDRATGVYSGELDSILYVDGVAQTIAITLEQAANYVETVIYQNIGSKINITAEQIDFINKCYADILNRPPEGSGLVYWAQTYATGNYSEREMYQLIVDSAIIGIGTGITTTGGGISLTPRVQTSVDDFTYSVAAASVTENSDGLLVANYTDILADDNLTRVNTISEFWTDMYQSYLGRDPETAGLEYWIDITNQFGINFALKSFREAADINISAGLEPLTGTNVFTGQ
jgi:hypothetical protein